MPSREDATTQREQLALRSARTVARRHSKDTRSGHACVPLDWLMEFECCCWTACHSASNTCHERTAIICRQIKIFCLRRHKSCLSWAAIQCHLSKRQATSDPNFVCFQQTNKIELLKNVVAFHWNRSSGKQPWWVTQSSYSHAIPSSHACTWASQQLNNKIDLLFIRSCESGNSK